MLPPLRLWSNQSNREQNPCSARSPSVPRRTVCKSPRPESRTLIMRYGDLGDTRNGRGLDGGSGGWP